MTKLDFYDDKRMDEMEKAGTQILASCHGRTLREVMERLNAPLTVGQLLAGILAEAERNPQGLTAELVVACYERGAAQQGQTN